MAKPPAEVFPDQMRFTPTRVGESFLHGLQPVDLSFQGSPPPAWGKHPHSVKFVAGSNTGFTPTRVGKASSACRCTTGYRHPGFTPTRVGKATPQTSLALDGFYVGSPPPAWGKQTCGRADSSLLARGSPPPAWGKR